MSAQMTAVELNKMRMETAPDERTPEERKRARRKLAKSKRKRNKQEISLAKAAARDRKLVFMAIVVAGLIFLGVIFVSAYCASIKYEINTINKETIALQEDIDQLKVEIENGTNIGTIEQKALKNLKMIYPTAEQFVYIDAEKPKGDMAQVIKENAYEF